MEKQNLSLSINTAGFLLVSGTLTLFIVDNDAIG